MIYRCLEFWDVYAPRFRPLHALVALLVIAALVWLLFVSHGSATRTPVASHHLRQPVVRPTVTHATPTTPQQLVPVRPPYTARHTRRRRRAHHKAPVRHTSHHVAPAPVRTATSVLTPPSTSVAAPAPRTVTPAPIVTLAPVAPVVHTAPTVHASPTPDPAPSAPAPTPDPAPQAKGRG